MAILILALKYIGWLIAIILLAIAIILALPVSLTAACALTIESNLEQALDLLDEEDLDNIGLFLYDGSFEVKCRALLGLVIVSMSGSTGPELRLAGIKRHLSRPGNHGGSENKGSGEPRESGEADALEEPGEPKTGKADRNKQGKQVDKPVEPKPEKPREGKARKGRRIDLREIKQYLSPAVRARVMGFLKSLFRIFHVQMDLDIELGLFDPYHTAVVFGMFSAATGALGISGFGFTPTSRVRGWLHGVVVLCG